MISSRKPVPSPLQTTEKQQHETCSNLNQQRGSRVGLVWGWPSRAVRGHVRWLPAAVPGPVPCPVPAAQPCTEHCTERSGVALRGVALKCCRVKGLLPSGDRHVAPGWEATGAASFCNCPERSQEFAIGCGMEQPICFPARTPLIPATPCPVLRAHLL